MTRAVAVGELKVGRDAMLECLSAQDPIKRLEKNLSSRPYFKSLIIGPAQWLSISRLGIAEICRRHRRNDRFTGKATTH